MAAAALWGMCLIFLAWAALWLQPPYGRVLNMFGMGHPMAVAALWGVCLICLAWAALWLRPPCGGCVVCETADGRRAAWHNMHAAGCVTQQTGCVL